jgi:hypothetical protein
MSNYTALLDANVLYPAPLRDLLLQLAITDLFRAKWTADIHREWIEALLRQEPHRDRTKLERTRALMDSHIRDCLVSGYESQIPTLELPDPDDRHVLAAAIVGRCDVIVTQTSGIFRIQRSHPTDRRSASGRLSLQSPQPGAGSVLWGGPESPPQTPEPALYDRAISGYLDRQWPGSNRRRAAPVC